MCVHVGGGGQSRNFHLFPVRYNLEERREHLDPHQKSGQKYGNSVSIILVFRLRNTLKCFLFSPVLWEKTQTQKC